MLPLLDAGSARLRALAGSVLSRLGLRQEAYLLLLAGLVGIVTSIAAFAFHELIYKIRELLYDRLDPHVHLYGRGIWLLAVLPALGGLIVGIVARYIVRVREGHGVVDVIVSVIRASGFIRPGAAIEKILTSAVTIGSGGSAGAEGPIVQIGAAIASGIGQLFRVARPFMPLLIGCGAAAGISSIFNSPIGGVLFTLEVILQEFSIRTFMPVVLASVIANVTTQAVFRLIHDASEYKAIFDMPSWEISGHIPLDWSQVGNFILLGLVCGVVGVSLTRLMFRTEKWFGGLKLNAALRPALGGAMLGLTGIAYVLLFGWFLLGQKKPFDFDVYPMPAFFGDGYGVIRQLLTHSYYDGIHLGHVLLLLAALCVLKLLGTCLTLSSGGAGGIIAPSLFLGAAAGAIVGLLLRQLGWWQQIQPEVYALVGMGAVLAAVVHAPLASILIVFELTHDSRIILPAMLACIFATGTARSLFEDSIYTLGLRKRGIRVGTTADVTLLRRLTVEQVELEPASIVNDSDPFQRILDLMARTGASSFVAVDEAGRIAGMLVAQDIKTVLLEREAVPLLLVQDVMRTDLPLVQITDDLGMVLDIFTDADVDQLPVCRGSDQQVIGQISRSALMRRYQRALLEQR